MRSLSQPNEWACWEQEAPWPMGARLPDGKTEQWGEKWPRRGSWGFPAQPQAPEARSWPQTLGELEVNTHPRKTPEHTSQKTRKVAQSGSDCLFISTKNKHRSTSESSLASWPVKPAIIYYTAFAQLLTKFILPYCVNNVKTCHHKVYSTDVSCLPLKQLRNNQKWIRIIASQHGKWRYYIFNALNIMM